MKRTSLNFLSFSCLIILILFIGLSCGGREAPFGSTVTILNPIDSVLIPPGSINQETVAVLVTGPDGEPLNDVRVRFELSFAGINDLVVDTDGDGIGDAPAISFIDPDGCGGTPCERVSFEEQMRFDAIVFSPFEARTDRRGIARVIVLMSGDIQIDPASFTALTGGGGIDSFEFSVTNTGAQAQLDVFVESDVLLPGQSTTVNTQTILVPTGARICFDVPTNSVPASVVEGDDSLDDNCTSLNSSGMAVALLTAGAVSEDQIIIVRGFVDINMNGIFDPGELNDFTAVSIEVPPSPTPTPTPTPLPSPSPALTPFPIPSPTPLPSPVPFPTPTP